jgi:hypothetical protein
MGRSWYIPIFVVMISFLQCIVLSLGFAATSSVGGFSAFSETWMIADFVCDLVITIETARLLFRRGAASSFKDTRGLVTKLIRLTLETGAVTTAAMLLLFILSRYGQVVQGLVEASDGVTVATLSETVYVAQLSVFYSISRLYANCLLATLNARLVISKDSTHVQQVSTVLFDVPASANVPGHPPANYVNVTISRSLLYRSRLEAAGDVESVYSEGAQKPNEEGMSQV